LLLLLLILSQKIPAIAAARQLSWSWTFQLGSSFSGDHEKQLGSSYWY
jgi:hypothetical protein